MRQDQKERLEKALDMLSDVQIELIKEDDRRPELNKTAEWLPLYRLRIDLRSILERGK